MKAIEAIEVAAEEPYMTEREVVALFETTDLDMPRGTIRSLLKSSGISRRVEARNYYEQYVFPRSEILACIAQCREKRKLPRGDGQGILTRDEQMYATSKTIFQLFGNMCRKNHIARALQELKEDPQNTTAGIQRGRELTFFALSRVCEALHVDMHDISLEALDTDENTARSDEEEATPQEKQQYIEALRATPVHQYDRKREARYTKPLRKRLLRAIKDTPKNTKFLQVCNRTITDLNDLVTQGKIGIYPYFVKIHGRIVREMDKRGMLTKKKKGESSGDLILKITQPESEPQSPPEPER